MLTTLLSNKVKGGKWHALIDKVYAPLNLFTAARKVTGKNKAAGVDGQSCEAFDEHLTVETRKLSEEIRTQSYRPGAVRRVHIPKPGRPNETGYSFRGDQIYPRRESLAKMKARITELTPRKRSGSVKLIAAELSSVLRGWFGYFRHCRWTIFKDLDARIHARLRRLLLKRHRKNPKRLPRTHRWPNAYFAKAGLYSLREAHFRFAQSVNYITG